MMMRLTLGAALWLGMMAQVQADGFALSSPDVAPDSTLRPAQVYKGYGCTGGNVAPALAWSGEPANTRSFAVTVYDPDALHDGGWWHWLVLNVPASVHSLPQASGQVGGAALPAGTIQTKTDFGAPGFGGACPPVGNKPHRYFFTVWALKADKLAVASDATPAAVKALLDANALGRAEIIAHYGR